METVQWKWVEFVMAVRYGDCSVDQTVDRVEVGSQWTRLGDRVEVGSQWTRLGDRVEVGMS